MWYVCGATPLNSDVVLAAEGARAAGTLAAEAKTIQEQAADLPALRAAALELEHARVAANKPFTRMTLEPLKVSAKCVFKLKGMAGASKLTKKDSNSRATSARY